MGLEQPFLRRVRRGFAVVALGVAVSALASDGQVAHAANTLTSSNPADGSSLSASPVSLQFTFVEPLGPINQVIVTCNGDPFSVGDAVVGPDGISLTTAVPSPMPKGTCNAVATVSAADSSPNGSSSISFTITADTAATAAPTTPTADTTAAGTTDTIAPTTTADDAAADGGTDVGGPLGLARVIATLGLATLLGSFVLIVMAWPEGVEYILTVRFLRSTWILALVGTVLTVVLLTAQTSGRSIGGSLSPFAWLDLKDSGSGLAALARVVLTAACGWVVIRPERCLDQATQLPALAVPIAAVATLGLERTGGDLALVGVVAGIVHALAMAIWLGGIVLLARVVLAGPGDDDLVHAVRGFSRIATPALLVTIITGAIQTYRLDRGALFDTAHGRVLLLKALAVGVMVFIGLATRQFVASRLRTTDAMTVPLASRLRRATSFEALGGIVVLVLSSWLLSLTPAGVVDETPAVTYAYTDGRFVAEGLELTISLTGGVGPNGVRVEVKEPAEGLSNLIITFVPPVDSGANGVVLTIPAELTGTGAAVLPQSEGVPLMVAGVWTLEVSVTTPSGTTTGQKTFNLLG
ncbi:MAG: CopD family protein [Ilumatobacteraceae bacterium]